MTTRIRAHFDGRVIVPDESVNLPVGQPLTLDVVVPNSLERALGSDGRQQLEEFFGLAVNGAGITDEALRRENLYEDRA